MRFVSRLLADTSLVRAYCARSSIILFLTLITVSATAVIIFDTFLSFQSDCIILTKTGRSVPKIAYFAYRYLMITAVVLFLVCAYCVSPVNIPLIDITLQSCVFNQPDTGQRGERPLPGLRAGITDMFMTCHASKHIRH